MTGEHTVGGRGSGQGRRHRPQQGDGTHPTVPKCPGDAGVRPKVFRLLLLLLVLGFSLMGVPKVHTAHSWGPESHAPGPEAELWCPSMRVLGRFLAQGTIAYVCVRGCGCAYVRIRCEPVHRHVCILYSVASYAGDRETRQQLQTDTGMALILSKTGATEGRRQVKSKQVMVSLRSPPGQVLCPLSLQKAPLF